MCRGHADPGRANASPGTGARAKLWNLPSRYHCPVIGTCLTIRELRKLYRRSGLQGAGAPPADYELHVLFVGMARERGRVSRLVHKTLDRKYRLAVRRAATLRNEEALCGFWGESVSCGEQAAAFWAALTHPLAGEALRDRIHGEVHMLSHLSGTSARADLARLPGIEERNRQLERELRELKFESNRKLSERQRRLDESNRHLEQLRRRAREIADLRQRVRELEGGDEMHALRELASRLRRELSLSRARVDAAELKAATRERKVRQMRDRIDPPRDTCRATPPGEEEVPAPAEDPKALAGRCVLYVGGRARLAPHLRRAVVQLGGRLVHHDGGLGDGWSALDGALEQADAVMCPLDCVSHNACARLKRACKSRSKPLVLLRSAGMGAFARGLRLLQQSTATGPASPCSGDRTGDVATIIS